MSMIYDHKPKNACSPNAYAGVNKGYGPGAEAGFALFSGKGKDEATGLTGSAEIGYGDFYAGGRSDGQWGLGGRAGLFNGSGGWEGDSHFAKVNHGLFTAEADAHVGTKSTGFSLGADIINGGVEFGEKNANSASDEAFGISAGIGTPGASAHLLYDDADGDGYREYGFDLGGKLGPGFGIKYTTEDPLRSAMGIMPGMGLMNDLVFGSDTNMTAGAIDMASSAGSAIADGASAAWSVLTGW